MFFYFDISSLHWLSFSAFLHTLYKDAELLALLLMNSTRIELQFVLFSQYSRTDRPSRQHRNACRFCGLRLESLIKPSKCACHLLTFCQWDTS